MQKSMNSEDQITVTLIDNGLPEGWESTSLKTVATLKKGKKPYKVDKTTWPGAVPYIDIEAFEKGNIRRYADQESSALVNEGDIIVVWDGARCGHVGKAPERGALGSTLGTIQPILVYPDYILRFLQLSYETINTNPRGIGIPHVEPELFWNLEIPLAPLAEQKRIVAKVEELLTRVNATKERLAKVAMILKRFRQAVLVAACSGRLTADWGEKNLDIEPASELLKRIQQDRKKPKKPYLNRTSEEGDIYFDIPVSWSFCFFEDICSDKPHAIKAGPFGSSLTKSCYSPSGYKIYGQEQVIRGDANYGDYYIDEKKFLELKSCEVEARDLLISLVGTIGKVLIIPDKFEKGIINPRLVKVSLHSEISPKYIAKYLGSPLAINMFKRDSHGGTMEILNLKMIKELPIPLPPVNEQHEIVRRVEAMFKLADAVEKRVAAATVRTEKLAQAILAKAFRGELVTTEAELSRREGRSYEPASVLLACIKSEGEKNRKPEAKRRASRK